MGVGARDGGEVSETQREPWGWEMGQPWSKGKGGIKAEGRES